jgi:hypothetical protein
MPLSEHYKGDGEKVARSMKRRYGKRWKQVFYATENKQKKRKRKAVKR